MISGAKDPVQERIYWRHSPMDWSWELCKRMEVEYVDEMADLVHHSLSHLSVNIILQRNCHSYEDHDPRCCQRISSIVVGDSHINRCFNDANCSGMQVGSSNFWDVVALRTDTTIWTFPKLYHL